MELNQECEPEDERIARAPIYTQELAQQQAYAQRQSHSYKLTNPHESHAAFPSNLINSHSHQLQSNHSNPIINDNSAVSLLDPSSLGSEYEEWAPGDEPIDNSPAIHSDDEASQRRTLRSASFASLQSPTNSQETRSAAIQPRNPHNVSQYQNGIPNKTHQH